MNILNGIGLRGMSGTYTRKGIYSSRKLSYDWYLQMNDIGECILYTNDALTDCYTFENAVFFSNIDEALQKLKTIIEEAAK